MKEKTIYKSVHNYTKFKLIEMLIKRFQENKTIEYDLDSIESLADDVINVLSYCGLKYYTKLNKEFK